MAERKEKLVVYRETYQGIYGADASLSDQEAAMDVRERICNGENGPEECMNSCAFVPLDSNPVPEGCQRVLVPFAYERYGRIPVVVPEHATKKEIIKKAEERLEQMDAGMMDYYSSYLEDSEEIDWDGMVLDGDGNVLSDLPSGDSTWNYRADAVDRTRKLFAGICETYRELDDDPFIPSVDLRMVALYLLRDFLRDPRVQDIGKLQETIRECPCGEALKTEMYHWLQHFCKSN